MKKFVTLVLCLSLLMSTSVFAAVQAPMVWAYDPAHEGYVAGVSATIVNHVPKSAIKAFNDHNGQVVISTLVCDPRGKAGATNGEPTATGWYTWPSSGKVYVDITPSYGPRVLNETVLHEFGHVFDMATGATNDTNIIAVMASELPAYNSLEVSTGYAIPSVSDTHELFAQVFAAVVSRNDGTVARSADIIAACPNTASYISSLIAKNP